MNIFWKIRLVWYRSIFIQSPKNPGRNILAVGSGCGAVGRAVATDTRGLGFESSHRQLLLNIYLLFMFVEMTKIKKKRPGIAQFKKEIS